MSNTTVTVCLRSGIGLAIGAMVTGAGGGGPAGGTGEAGVVAGPSGLLGMATGPGGIPMSIFGPLASGGTGEAVTWLSFGGTMSGLITGALGMPLGGGEVSEPLATGSGGTAAGAPAALEGDADIVSGGNGGGVGIGTGGEPGGELAVGGGAEFSISSSFGKTNSSLAYFCMAHQVVDLTVVSGLALSPGQCKKRRIVSADSFQRFLRSFQLGVTTGGGVAVYRLRLDIGDNAVLVNRPPFGRQPLGHRDLNVGAVGQGLN